MNIWGFHFGNLLRWSYTQSAKGLIGLTDQFRSAQIPVIPYIYLEQRLLIVANPKS